MHIAKYEIISAHTPEELSAKVATLLSADCQPFGGVQVVQAADASSPQFIQAMVYYEMDINDLP